MWSSTERFSSFKMKLFRHRMYRRNLKKNIISGGIYHKKLTENTFSGGKHRNLLKKESKANCIELSKEISYNGSAAGRNFLKFSAWTFWHKVRYLTYFNLFILKEGEICCSTYIICWTNYNNPQVSNQIISKHSINQQ